MLQNIMLDAWRFIKKNGFTRSEALVMAWRNYKLHQALMVRIVKFYFMKVDGTIREAYGTLNGRLVPATLGCDRKKNDTVQVYYDTEVEEWRSYKKANLIKIA